MSNQELEVPEILQIADICQYMAVNAGSNARIFKGNYFDNGIGKLIYLTRRSVQNRYDANPNDSTLQATSNYLYALLGRFALQARARLASFAILPPVINGPVNVTVNVGQNGTFTVSVVSSTPFTLQWYNAQTNTPIAGATGLQYTVPNAQLTDSGKQFYVKATNPAGTVTSNTAVLVVQAALQGQFAYMDTNPFPQLQSGVDNLTYQSSFSITHNADFNIPMPIGSNLEKYLVAKVPVGEPLKTHWFNDSFNLGLIPDFNWQVALQFGGYTYYISRRALSLPASILQIKA